MTAKQWCKLLCKNTELQLKGTLNGGQSFRWKKAQTSTDENGDVWIGVFKGCVWRLKQEDAHILYNVHDPNQDSIEPPIKKKRVKNNHDDVESDANLKYENLLRNYFHLDLDLGEHYAQWSDADPNFKAAAEHFYGIRILAQDPVENLFSFICSSNNHITRISSMIEKMCTLYGNKICDLDGITYHSFPEVTALAQPGVEKQLREAGFGYRAGYIHKSANMIIEMGGNEWFDKLREMDYPDAKKSLMMLTGIGAKVADCICLMSLGHLDAIPVDTHVYQIAKRNYLKHLSTQKTVTERVYNEIGDYFRKLYGPLAGWAHTVLFCADLKIFQNPEEKKKSASKRKSKKKS